MNGNEMLRFLIKIIIKSSKRGQTDREENRSFKTDENYIYDTY